MILWFHVMILKIILKYYKQNFSYSYPTTEEKLNCARAIVNSFPVLAEETPGLPNYVRLINRINLKT